MLSKSLQPLIRKYRKHSSNRRRRARHRIRLNSTFGAANERLEDRILLAADPSFAWAVSPDGDSTETDGDWGRGISTDGGGNIFSIDAGRSRGGSSWTFLTKHDPWGNKLWQQVFSGTESGTTGGGDTAVDADGHVIATGQFNGTVDFGNSITLTARSTATDIYVVKLDGGTGQALWATQLGSEEYNDGGGGLAVDSSNNVYVSGETWNGISTFNADIDILLGKLDGVTGDVLWTREIGSDSAHRGHDVAVDGNGYPHVTGEFSGKVDFDPGPGTYTLDSGWRGNPSTFVLKLNPDGNFVWAGNFASSAWSSNHGRGVAVDGTGAIHVTGTYYGTVDFDPGSDTAKLESNNGDVFVTKLHADGSFAWARSLGGADNDEGFGIAVDSDANVYTTGHFLGTADFDPGATEFSLTSAGDTDVFVSKLDRGGQFVWAGSMGGEFRDGGYSIAVDGSGNIHATGWYRGPADFDPDPNEEYLLPETPSRDAFVVKLSQGNNAPSAVDDAFAVDEDMLLSVNAPGVLSNDSDFDGDALTAALVSGPSHGTLTLNEDGSFSYTPDSDFHGIDALVYAAQDGKGGSAEATVTLTVNPINDAPVAVGNFYSTPPDTTLTVAAPGVLSNDTDVDGDALTAVLDAGPTNGTLDLNSDGSFTYTPNAGFSETDSFSYHASDGLLNSGVVSVSITINAAPVAGDDSYSTNEDTALTVIAPGVLSNDTDADGDSLSAILVSGPENGSLSFSADDGSFTYTPNPNYNGPDSFTYRASDGIDTSNTAVVSLVVNAVNDAPVAQDDAYSTKQGQTLTVAAPGLLSNDTDIDSGDTLTVDTTPDPGPSNGTLVLYGDGSFEYTPNPSFTGDDVFSYKISDSNGETSTAQVTITVRPAAKFYVADDDADAAFLYNSSGDSTGSFTVNLSAPRGMTAIVDGTNWVLDANGAVSQYDSSGAHQDQASWTAEGLQQPEGIATTDGATFWIVDQKANQAIQYDSTGGKIGGFALHKNNTRASGITSYGTSIWVVNDHPKWDQVFKYDTSGSLEGNWNLDGNNANPTGITIDLENTSNLWVVDAGTDRVYQYVGGASRTSGGQSADSYFALTAGNTNPQGIADPPALSGSNGALTPTPAAGEDFSSPPSAILAWWPGANGSDRLQNGLSNDRRAVFANVLPERTSGASHSDRVSILRYGTGKLASSQILPQVSVPDDAADMLAGSEDDRFADLHDRAFESDLDWILGEF